MKKLILSVAFALLGCCLAQQSSAQSVLDFKLVNNTGIILYEFHIGESSSSEWSADLLPTNVIGDGEEVNVSFTRVTGNTDCNWDVLVTKDAAGNASVVVAGVDLCEVSVLTLSMEGGKIVYSAE